MESCVFCRIVAGTAPSHRVYEDEDAVAFMDVFPATEGHTLVIPRAHIENLWSIDVDQAGAVMRAAVRVGRLLREALSPDGLNILHATGAAAFQTVFHYHLHLIPRYRGDGVRLPWARVPASQSELASTAARIRSAG